MSYNLKCSGLSGPMSIFHACVARLAKSMLSYTCAFQITLSSYFSFLMTLPLATLTSLLLTPSWCWVLGKSGPSSNISHLRLSPLIILLLSVLVVQRSFHQEQSTTYKKNFYDSAAHLFMFSLVLHFSPTNMLLIGNNSKLFSDRTFENSGWGFWY